jgi:hypothetical protein
MQVKTERWKKWNLRTWTCCDHRWELLLSNQFPERFSFVPKCPTCGANDAT